MTHQRQLYLDDTYLFSTTTTVLGSRQASTGVELLLADNLFHPAGGGQPDDTGAVNGHPVASITRSDGGLVWVGLGGTSDLFAAGTTVVARVDPDLRRLHAALHTAGHLIDAILRRQPFLAHRASNHRPGQARVEYTITDQHHDEMIELLRADLPCAVQTLISDDLPVAASTTREGLRMVSIGDLHSDPCGGTHVSNTGSLSHFELRSLKKKAGLLKAGYSAEHAKPG